MRENKLLNILRTVIGDSSEVKGQSWTQPYLNYFGWDHMTFVLYFLLGWVLISTFVIYVLHYLRGGSKDYDDIKGDSEPIKGTPASKTVKPDTKTMVYKRVVDNLRKMHGNIEEFFDLATQDELIRLETARETEEVATLLCGRAEVDLWKTRIRIESEAYFAPE